MSLFSKAAEFFIGGAAKAVTDSAGEVADIVERWNPGDEKKAQIEAELSAVINNATESARSMALASHNTWFDVLVDGIARLIRPTITIWVTGGMMGVWRLPDISLVPPFYQQVFWTILTFWFGGRALLKDLPKAVMYTRGLK